MSNPTTKKRARSTDVNGSTTRQESKEEMMLDLLHEERKEREKIVLWRQPVTTLHYFIRETVCLTSEFSQRYFFFLFLFEILTADCYRHLNIKKSKERVKNQSICLCCSLSCMFEGGE